MHLAAVLQYAMTLVTAAQRNPTSRWGSFFTIGSPAFTAARILVPPGEVMPICACVGATGLAWLPHPRLLMTALAAVITGVAVWRRPTTKHLQEVS